MIRIHPLRTGSVRIRPSQRRRRPGGLARVLLDTRWTEWLPIYAWAIEHPEGVIVVDTGESAGASQFRLPFATFAVRAGISTFELSRYMGASLTMIDRHCGHLARDGREHAIKLLDALNGPGSYPVDAGGRSVDAETAGRRQLRKRNRRLSREKAEAL